MGRRVDIGLPAALTILALTIAGVIGWVMNIMAIAASDFSHITGLLILRIVGIFIGPLGAVLGYC